MEKVKVAMIGVGCISGIYLKNLAETFRDVELLGVCDLVRERAELAREKYSIPKIYNRMEDAFADPEVEIVLNLTRPCEHFAVSKGALMAGKHVYSEKPLGASLEEGQELMKLAREKGLIIGGAPDTFLGAGLQTCRQVIDSGLIGDVIGTQAFMIGHGPEDWHPDPDFYYQRGGGPMFDMGPYYLTAMVSLAGGIREVMAASNRTFAKRIITSKPFFGTPIDVNVDTTVAGTVIYDSGAIGTIYTTFDVHYPEQARLEIFGTLGTLFLPDPNCFGGPVKLYRPEDGAVKEIPLLAGYRENSRGIGLDDMGSAIRTGRQPRCHCQQTFHVLDVITGFERSARSGQRVKMSTEYKRPPALAKEDLPGHIG